MSLAREMVATIAVEVAQDPDLAAQLANALAPHLRMPERDAEGFLAPQEAAAYLGVSRKRVYDLTSARSLVPDGRDGRTPLFTRSTLDAYARSHV